MRTAKRRRRRGKFRRTLDRNTQANIKAAQVVQPAGVVETEHAAMIHVLRANPDGTPTHAACSQCQQHWHSDDPEMDLAGFVRTHLRTGYRYARYSQIPV